jgi:hypothetical protein
MQLVSLAGCFLILLGYAGLQCKRLDPTRLPFNVLNAVGSALLLWVAIVDRRMGFEVLESAWVLISVVAMLRHKRA